MNAVKNPGQITGLHVLLVMVCFFGVIIAVNITMAVIASKSWTGLVVKNSYVASQEYNDKIEAARIQNSVGLTSRFSYENDALSVFLLDREGDPVLAEAVSVKIGRPAYEQQDQIFILSQTDKERYVGDIRLQTGVWQVEIQAELTDQTYRRDIRLYVNEAGEGLVQ